ncbi:MAG: hypothetical protein ACC656_04135, partial [Candidatus Heimdallarchaeota archaeon]
MRASRFNRLPTAEQILIQKIEESIQEPLVDSFWGGWQMGITEESGRLVQIAVNRRWETHRKMLDLIPEEIGAARELRFVNFGTNRIPKIPEEIGNLRYLERCFLGRNRIAHMPDSFTNCRYLRILELQNNI